MAEVIVKQAITEAEMAALRALRMAVFIEEQGVPWELEKDELDDLAIHAAAYLDGVLIGTGRLIIDTPTDARIGRMAVKTVLRRTGLGSKILIFLENEARSQGIKCLRLHAQHYVKDFYRKHGYYECGDAFFEAGILHIEMKKEIGCIQTK